MSGEPEEGRRGPSSGSLHELFQREQFEAIESWGRETLARMEVEGSLPVTSTVELINLVVDAALMKGDRLASDVRHLSELAVRLVADDPTSEASREALGLLNLARVVRRQEGAEAALSPMRAALEAAGEAGPDEALLEASMLGELGGLHFEAGEYSEAATCHERQLGLQEEVLGKEHPALAGTLRMLGSAIRSTGQFERSLSYLERARSLAEQGGPSMRIELARILIVLGRANLNWTRLETGEAYLAQAVELAEREVGTRHPLYARAIRMHAAALRNLGRLDPAETLYLRALEIQRALPEPERQRALLDTLSSLSSLHYYRGDLVEARRLLDEVIEGERRLYGADYSALPWSLVMRGNILRELGLHREAERALREGIELAERTDPRDIAVITHLYLTLAVVFLDEGDTARFRNLYDRWFPEMVRIYGPESSKAQIGSFYEAICLVREGRPERARELLAEVLSRNETTQVASSPTLGNTLTLLAELELEVGDPHRAEQLFRTSLERRTESFGPDSVKVAVSLRGLSRALRRVGRTRDALEAALRAERISVELRRLGAEAFSEREALVYGSEALLFASDGYSPGIERGLDLILSIVADGSLSDRASLRVALDAVVRSRAIVLDELARRHRLATLMDDPELTRLAEELSEARSRYARLAVRSAAAEPGPEFAHRLDEARERKERAERALAARSSAFRNQKEIASRGLQEIARGLGPGQALVTYVRYVRELGERIGAAGAAADRHATRHVPSYTAWVVRDGGEFVTAVSLGPEGPITEAIERWHRAVSDPGKPVRLAAGESEKRYRSEAAALSRLVWEPLLKHLRGVEHLLVVPDGPLHLVSLATLPAGPEGYLIESGPPLEYLTVERDLLDRASGSDGLGLLALGGAAFDAAPVPPFEESRGLDLASLDLTVAKLSNTPVYRGPHSSCKSFEAVEFDPLPHSAEEVAEIARLWGDSDGDSGRGARDRAVVLTGSMAREALFKRLVPGRRVIHVATHGFFVDSDCESGLPVSRGASGLAFPGAHAGAGGENPLFLSGLALAGANNRDRAGAGQEDGVLTAEEVSTLDLTSAEWVVLSGCRTGTGPTIAGEGVFGLRRAFKIAGASAVIMSLWPVEDRTASRWMTALYRARTEGLDACAAVRRASLSVLESRRAAGRSTHPFHWGAFVPVR